MHGIAKKKVYIIGNYKTTDSDGYTSAKRISSIYIYIILKQVKKKLIIKPSRPPMTGDI